MKGTEMDITVLGATGGIGRALTSELVNRGHAVRAVSRRGTAEVAGARAHAADISDAVAVKEACAGADVVVMAAQPPYAQWVDHFPALMDNVIEAAASSRARLVFTDNLYMYAPAGGPLTESSPQHATDAKGRLRRELGEQLLDAHRRGAVRVAIGRFSDYYGPAGTNSQLHVLGIAPALAGRRPRGMVDLDQPHTLHYLPDAARGFATLVEDDRADGQVWLLPAAPAITQRTFFDLVVRSAGHAKRPGVVTPWMLRVAGIALPVVRESRSVVPQFDRPWVVDASRFTATFGAQATTPHDEAVAATVAWHRHGSER